MHEIAKIFPHHLDNPGRKSVMAGFLPATRRRQVKNLLSESMLVGRQN